MTHISNIHRFLGLGVVLGFLQATLYRELSLKIPINFFFAHFMILGCTGLAAGSLYAQRLRTYVDRHPYRLATFLGLFLVGIWVYKGDSIFFWTLSLYYPMPIPEYGWLKALAFVFSLCSLPVLFCLIGMSFAVLWQTSDNPRVHIGLFIGGMAVGTALSYPAQFLEPERMFIGCCLGLLFLCTRRPGAWVMGIVLCGLIVVYGQIKKNYPILLSLKDHTLSASKVTDNYKIDFYTFRNDSCVALAINEFIHVYTCREYEDLPVELSYLNKSLGAGLKDYRALIVGCSLALYPYQLFRANPSMSKCVLVDVDRGLASASVNAQEAIGLDLYKDPRFVIKAFEPRYYLELETDSYDLLYLHRVGNALIFYPFSIVPIEYYVLTSESLRHIFDRLLKNDGIYVLDWGIPKEHEVRQYVGSFPEGVCFRVFWTTLSNNPSSGAPLMFVIASRNKERLDEVGNRLLQATYFHEVSQDRWSDTYRITDDKPWLKRDVVTILTVAVIPFLIPLGILVWHLKSRKQNGQPTPMSRLKQYYFILGVVFSLLHAFALGRVTRLFPLGVNPGWLVVEGVFIVGYGLGLLQPIVRLRSISTIWFVVSVATLALAGSVLCIHSTKELFYGASAVLLSGFLLGQLFSCPLSRIEPSQRHEVWGGTAMGMALGIGVFQIFCFLMGFRITGLAASVLVVLAGIFLAQGFSTPSSSIASPTDEP